jgi:hypothetical protein
VGDCGEARNNPVDQSRVEAMGTAETLCLYRHGSICSHNFEICDGYLLPSNDQVSRAVEARDIDSIVAAIQQNSDVFLCTLYGEHAAMFQTPAAVDQTGSLRDERHTIGKT